MSSRIYAAEDDDNIREILRCTLESYGYEVEVFESAAPMLERMRQQLPDLVLMDIMMPEMDGYSRNDGYFAQRQRIYRTSGC